VRAVKKLSSAGRWAISAASNPDGRDRNVEVKPPAIVPHEVNALPPSGRAASIEDVACGLGRSHHSSFGHRARRRSARCIGQR
jgi:hypothetical protein